MEITRFNLAGLLEFIPYAFADERGYFAEIWREDQFMQHAGTINFVQENQSLSKQAGTIRGMHAQVGCAGQGKLIRCVAGAILDIAVDIRRNSPTFGQWVGIELSREALNQLWIPVGFAHGFCTLVPDTIVAYKVTNYYSPEHDRGFLWSDPAIGIGWPDIADATTLSSKDRAQPRFEQSDMLF